jgi:hypothetical protein
MKPLKLVTHRDELAVEVVEILERWLQKAKNGQLTSVAIVGLEPDGSACHERSGTAQHIALIGAVARLLHRMHEAADEVTKDVV